MSRHKIVIVGSSGTVGLDLHARLNTLPGIDISTVERATPAHERHQMLLGATIALLCLPEQAAREFVKEAAIYKNLRILDSSPAHRTSPEWVYGLPEMSVAQELRIRTAKKVANPGCYATGAILLLLPIIEAMTRNGVALKAPVAITAIGGVTSGGRKMIESANNNPFGYRLHGLSMAHRHVPEIEMHAGLGHRPILMPAVVGHQRGTMIQIPLSKEQLGDTFSANTLQWILQDHYKHNPSIVVVDKEERSFLQADALAMSDKVQLQVLSDEENTQFVLVAQFDNLGKGAAGAAVQNLKLMLSMQ